MRLGWLLTGLLSAVVLASCPTPGRAAEPHEQGEAGTEAVLKSVDPGKGTITVTIAGKEQTLPLSKKATFAKDVPDVKEIPDGSEVVLTMDKDTVTAVTAKHEQANPNIFKGFLDLSIWTIVIFLVLFFVLKKYAWGPMIEGLESREKNIQGELDQAQKANADAQALKAEFERKMNDLQQQARTIIDDARKNAERMAEEIKSKANADTTAERDRVRRELELEREQARVEIFQQGAQMASLMSSKALRRQMTIDDQYRLVEEALNDMGVAANERQRVLASVT